MTFPIQILFLNCANKSLQSFGNNIHCHHQMLLLPITVTVIKDSDYKTRASSLVLKPETDLVKQKWEFIFCILTVYDWVSISMHVLHAVPDIISCVFCHSSGPESKATSWFILGFELIRVIYMTFPVRFFLLLLFFFLIVQVPTNLFSLSQ